MGLAAGVMLLLSVVDMIYPVVKHSGVWPALPLVLLGAGLVALLDLAVGSFDLDAALASLARSSAEGIMSTIINLSYTTTDRSRLMPSLSHLSTSTDNLVGSLPVSAAGPLKSTEASTQRLRSALLTALALAGEPPALIFCQLTWSL